ncbi:unnamed protein product, partial [Ascophyllum nodosum]
VLAHNLGHGGARTILRQPRRVATRMRQVLKRQKKRGRGDDVAYVLARTVRSC